MTNSTIVRIALGYLAVTTGVVGAWAQLAPRSFYDNFPGIGATWISVDGPYNEHLIRDVGGLNLALTVLIVAAAITLDRRVVILASLGAATYGLPHVIYHVFNTDGLSGADVASNLTGLALFAVIPILLIGLVTRPAD
jgi:hypothetical protein